jgi:hypothetical protein
MISNFAIRSTFFGIILACFAALTPARAEWEARTVGDMTVETPAAFGDEIDVSAQLPAAAKALVEKLVVRQAGEEKDGLIAALTIVTYKPDAAVSIDGGVAGAITNAAAAMGDKNPKYSVSKFKAEIIRGQVFRRGQTLFQIQVITNKEKLADADRILDSIVLKAAK